MGSKRKRSSDDSPTSVSGFGPFSTPDAQSPTPFPQAGQHCMHMDLDTETDTDIAARANPWSFGNASRVKSSDWGHRTRKRFRDNRPDERSIHETTLNKLFAAQRNMPQASPIPSHPPPAPQPIHPVSKPQKSTLHSFWKQLPAPPVRPLIHPIQPMLHHATSNLPRCDDCEAPLQSEDQTMDVDMDTDMGDAVDINPFACIDCGKAVCGTCAVVSARRHCLQCATGGTKSSRWW